MAQPRGGDRRTRAGRRGDRPAPAEFTRWDEAVNPGRRCHHVAAAASSVGRCPRCPRRGWRRYPTGNFLDLPCPGPAVFGCQRGRPAWPAWFSPRTGQVAPIGGLPPRRIWLPVHPAPRTTERFRPVLMSRCGCTALAPGLGVPSTSWPIARNRRPRWAWRTRSRRVPRWRAVPDQLPARRRSGAPPRARHGRSAS